MARRTDKERRAGLAECVDCPWKCTVEEMRKLKCEFQRAAIQAAGRTR